MAKLSVQKVAKAMEKSGGIISVIADRCKVSWPAIDKFLKNHPELKE